MSERWVSVSEAARLEAEAGRAVNKSSISRFLDRNSDVLVKRDDRGRVVSVEYGSLARARGASLSVVDSHAGREAQDARPSKVGGIQPRNRKRELEEEKLELDLAERKGEVVDLAAVLMAVETAGLTFSQGLERRRRTLAQALEGIDDARERELIIKRSDRELMTALSKALETAAKGQMAEPADAEAA